MGGWWQVLGFSTRPLEIVLRGSIMYLALFAMLRVVLKRESGTTGVTDLLVIVLIADAAQNAMAGGYTSVVDGLLLVAVIIGWSYVLDRMAFHWRWAEKLIRPRSLLLVRDGRVVPRNLRRELLTERELLAQARQQGIDDLSRIREMRMEPDGQFSITVVDSFHHPDPARRKRQRY